LEGGNSLRDSNEPKRHILLVDPDEAFSRILAEVLGPDYALRRVSSVEVGLGELETNDHEIVLMNLDQPKGSPTAQDPRALLEAASERTVALPVIVYSWDVRRETATQIMQQGAIDFFPQPLDVRELKFALDLAYRRTALLRDLDTAQKLLLTTRIDGLLGNSKAMERANEIISKVAGVFTTVLITGESGTGKEVAARSIHRLSPRANKPFIAFSPCALPETLIEDELFGHEKGAFTGASQARRGRFEEAKGGTIFLDEIGDLALPLQAKLLRVLQERSLERLGSNAAVPIDVRVICATSRNLEKMVQEGSFREDLFFRISVVRLPMPPLRERREDIPLLAEYFLRMFAKAHNKYHRGFTSGFLTALTSYNWPGNVRELQNVIERTLVLADDKEQLGVRDLPPELRSLGVVSDDPLSGSFHLAVRSFKRELVRAALRMHSGNKLRAAQELSISRCYLHRLLNQLHIKDAMGAEEEQEETIPLEGSDAFSAAEALSPSHRVH
jgi:two-component system, NtrC family, response regulator HydG